MGRTSRIFNGHGMEVQYRYDSYDRIREITYGNHVVTQYNYNGDGNVSCLETKAGEDILLSFCYEYDGNGNRTAKYGEQATAHDGKQKVRTSYREDRRSTRTYKGRGKQTMKSDEGLSARERMVLDIIDIRKNFGTKYNKGLLKAVKYAKSLPQFKK